MITVYVMHDTLTPNNVRLTREIPDNTPVKIGDTIDHEGAGYPGTVWHITAIDNVVVVMDGRPCCPYTSVTVRVSDQRAPARMHGVQFGSGNIQHNQF